MWLNVSWRSEAGVKTEDNRDCAGIGFKGAEMLCIVIDGSTAAPDSGALAWQLACRMVDWYVNTEGPSTAKTVIAQLRHVHAELASLHPRSSASYLIACVRNTGAAFALHAGDCLLGKRNSENEVNWLTRPHTLANVFEDVPTATLAFLPARHRLTRSFRLSAFMAPDIGEVGAEEELLIATDGFWADLNPQDQIRFLEGQDLPTPTSGDDRSLLRIWLTGEAPGERIKLTGDENIYVRDRQ